MAVSERISHLMGALDSAAGVDSSRATSPGGDWRQTNGDVNGTDEDKQSRSRLRTFPYFESLPYKTEGQDEREENLNTCLKHLYIAVSAGDFAPGAVHWTREIRGWLSLKFDVPRSTRVKLVNLYYELALAPGLDYLVAERFASMFMVLTKRKHYLRPGKDLVLDWRPLFRELKLFVLPSESGGSQPPNVKRNVRTLTKMCTFAQLYFDPQEIPAILEEILPFFTTSYSEGAFVVIGLLNLLLPTSPAPEERADLQPQQYLPLLFHLCSLVNRSKLVDAHFMDILSRLARDTLTAPHIKYSEFGMFTGEQCSLMFTAILRLLEIPVGQATSPYSTTVDLGAGLAIMLDRDQRRHPSTHHISRTIIMSLSPECMDRPDSVLSKLEGLIQAIETFYHPSNSGHWTRTLAQLVYYLGDFFVLRWNREHSGEMDVPEGRRLTPALKRRFVLCLREVTFMGIFSKSDKAVAFSLNTLQFLAYLEPTLILPGALQRVYPAMQGLVEVHRTISSIKALQVLSKIMARTKGYRCHVTTLLGLALPGIDPNDLDKTVQTLSYIQGVCYTVPFHDLTQEKRDMDGESAESGATTPMEGVDAGTGLAVQWITEQVERLESAQGLVEIDYEKELSNHEEEMILRSSTTGLAEFLHSFLGRVFTLLENLPDAARVRSNSPEESVANHLPAAFTPLLAALSPELYDIALEKVANFITNHVIHQARDAISFICNSLVKVNPEKALKRLLPHLIAGIRTEIDDNRAGSTRTAGTDVLPRDRALVWYLCILSMSVVHVGDAVIAWKDELFEIAEYMQRKCRGAPTLHVSNFIHHLLLNCTCTYTIDYSIYEDDELKKGLTTDSWGKQVDPKKLTLKWHRPSQEEIDFAVKLFDFQVNNSINTLVALTSSDPPIKREGTGKDWSDEVSRNLGLLRLLTSGISVLFDVRHDQVGEGSSAASDSGSDSDAMDTDDIEDDGGLGEAEDEEVKPTFQYETGYPLQRGDENYKLIHNLRHRTGEVLHRVHQFLIEKQEDDVPCFNSLYNAYRSWFIDVGIERSAHVLERITRLLESDEGPFRFSGLRKEYPRSLLVRRANVYHLQRLRHNAAPRPKTDLDKRLLLDLAESSISLYTEIRRTAQTANESAVKCILGARPLVIPPLLDALVKAVAENDYPRIKGAMFTLLFGSLAKTISRDWRFTPTLIKAFIEVTGADKPSVQKLATNATFQVMDMGKAMERMVILDKDVVEALTFAIHAEEDDTVQKKVVKRRDSIKKKRARIEGKKAELSKELIDISKTSHWKKVSRTAAIIVNLGMRYDTIASDEVIQLVTKGSIDQHPSLRGLYAGALVGLFAVIQTRAITGHSYERYLLGEEEVPDRIAVPTKADDPNWTEEHLATFAKPEAKYYVDFDYPGWLVWTKTMPAALPNPPLITYDNVEMDVRKKIGSFLDRSWFSNYFAFMKQEPRDSAVDRFRMSTAMLLAHTFELVFRGLTKATFEDIKDLTQAVYADGSDKHQHRATAEIMGALICCAPDLEKEQRQEVWEYVFPIIRGIFQDGLNPDNSNYWTTFLHVVIQSKDPRRAWPLIDWLASFRLDMESNAAFKESSKIYLLQQCIADAGWHFRLEKPILEDFMQHLDHPYKGVREAMGQTIAAIYRTRYHESYKDVDTLIKAQKEASSIGVRPYEPTEEFSKTIAEVFDRLEVWRGQRPAGQQTPSSYTSGGKTVLLWLDSTLSSYECTQLVKFFPNTFTEQLLHMMDIKEDPELQSLAYHVFRHLPNIPHRQGEDAEFIAALIRIGRTATSWHQRLRILINIQVIYFRRLFLMSEPQQLEIYECVSDMLQDTQLEVRMGAATTLSGMIRCSPTQLRDRMVAQLKTQFTTTLNKNPLPKKSRIPGTPTPEQNKLVLTRHAVVLGLGALIQAFPYTSPPPAWYTDVLATLARKAAADPGMVGKSVKTILADFKKTRQDTWHVDVKAFDQEQLEDLEGVLWKSYFA